VVIWIGGCSWLIGGVGLDLIDINAFKRKVIFFKICLGRGQTYLSDFKNIFLFAMGFKIFGLSVEQGFILGFLGVLAFVVIGWLDLRYGIWRMESEISTREVNPYFERLEKSVEKKHGKKSVKRASKPAVAG
jgi:hypothetical protein